MLQQLVRRLESIFSKQTLQAGLTGLLTHTETQRTTHHTRTCPEATVSQPCSLTLPHLTHCGVETWAVCTSWSLASSLSSSHCQSLCNLWSQGTERSFDANAESETRCILLYSNGFVAQVVHGVMKGTLFLSDAETEPRALFSGVRAPK